MKNMKQISIVIYCIFLFLFNLKKIKAANEITDFIEIENNYEDDIETIKLNNFLLNKLQSYINYYTNSVRIDSDSNKRLNCTYVIIDKLDWTLFYSKYHQHLFNDDVNNGEKVGSTSNGLYFINTDCLNSYLNKYIRNELKNLHLLITGVDFRNANIGSNLSQILNENDFLTKNSSDSIKYLNFKNTSLTFLFDTLSDNKNSADEYDYVIDDVDEAPVNKQSSSLLKKFKNLEILVFDDNEEIILSENVFEDLTNLKFLSLKKCRLNEKEVDLFSDVAYRQPKLDYLSLSGNDLKKIKFKNSITINFLDLSHNSISSIDRALISDNDINAIKFDDNFIENLDVNYLNKSINLSLKYNRIETISSIVTNEEIISVYLAGNPLKCDCHSLWLQSYNHNDYKNFLIIDYSQLECHYLSSASNSNRSLISMSRQSDYKCQYSTNCNYQCKCCSYKHCYCFSKCPAKCKCYIDSFSSENIIDCSNLPVNEMPKQIFVESATELRLTNNEIKILKPTLLFGYARLNRLFLNKNEIEEIDPEAFNFLSNTLETLDLSCNRIENLNISTFINLKELKVLNLINNSIQNIDETFYSLSKLKNLQTINLLHNNLTEESRFIVENFLISNKNIQIDYSIPTSVAISTTTTTTTTIKSTTIRTTISIAKTKSKQIQTTFEIFNLQTEINEKLSDLRHTKLTNTSEKNLNYNKILKISLITLCIGGLLLLLIIYLLFMLYKIRTTRDRERQNYNITKPDKNKYLKFCQPLNSKGALSINSDLTSTTATAIVSAASMSPPKSTLSSSLTTTLPNNVNSEEYCMIKSDNDSSTSATNYNDETNEATHYSNVNDLTIIASNSINDINLYINIYYHQYDNNFVNIYLMPILRNIHIIPNKHIVLKPQADLYIELSEQEKRLLSTGTSDTLSSNHYYNIDSIDRTSINKFMNLKFFRKEKRSQDKNVLHANIFVISCNFQGLRSLLTKKNNLKSFFKIFISNTTPNNENNYETINTNKMSTVVSQTNNYAINNTLSSVFSTSEASKNRWFTLFNKNKNFNDAYLFNSIKSFNGTNDNTIDHIYQSQISLESQISLYIENLYQKLSKSTEDDIDFHLLNYRKSANIFNV